MRRSLAPRRLGRLRAHDPRTAQAIEAVSRERLTYLELPALLDLAEATREVERLGRDGCLIETGSAYGGSAIVLAAAKSQERNLRIYDVFGEFPAPGARDAADAHDRYAEIAGGSATWTADKPFYAYVEDLPATVRDSFRRYELPPEENSVELIQGLIEETLVVNGPVALAHIDCDWYDPVLASLERICPELVKGGRVSLDDYDDWQGTRRAVEDYLAHDSTLHRERRSRLHLVKSG